MINLWKHNAHPKSQETKREITEITYELLDPGLCQTFIGEQDGINDESVRRSACVE